MAYLSFYMVLPRKMKRDFVIQQIVESVLNNWEAISKIIQLDLGRQVWMVKAEKLKMWNLGD